MKLRIKRQTAMPKRLANAIRGKTAHMVQFIEFVRFLYLCGQGYRRSSVDGPYYGKMSRCGVPQVTVIISRGRKAWEFEQALLEHFEIVKGR